MVPEIAPPAHAHRHGGPELISGNPAQSSIEAIIRLEEEDEVRVDLMDRLAGTLGRWIGTVTFIVLQLFAAAVWLVVNTRAIPAFPVFDPYPFVLLAGVLCLECVLPTSLVLIRQNRMMAPSDKRNHLGLQVTLLAEKESTKIIQMLERLSREMGLEGRVTDNETRELSKETPVKEIAEELRRHNRLNLFDFRKDDADGPAAKEQPRVRSGPIAAPI